MTERRKVRAEKKSYGSCRRSKSTNDEVCFLAVRMCFSYYARWEDAVGENE